MEGIGCQGIGWNHLAQDRVLWGALMNIGFTKVREFIDQLGDY
jgi:hypothetical protein